MEGREGRKGGKKFKAMIVLREKKMTMNTEGKKSKRYKPLSKIITSAQNSSLIPVGKFKYKLVYFSY